MNIWSDVVDVGTDSAVQLTDLYRDEYVCWSRMQAEAGQPLSDIVSRKELERRAGNGIFMWGVGNAPALVASVLARAGIPVRVVFSIMKSRPKLIDSSPNRTVAWRRYIDARGAERSLPPHCLVTSRGHSASGNKRTHFALMCFSDEPLEIQHGEPFDPSCYRNASSAGASVGSSQVTALLKKVGIANGNDSYEANLTAWLTGSYWVRLTDPIELTHNKLNLVKQLSEKSAQEWTAAIDQIRSGPSNRDTLADNPSLL